ncbi:hypothetical protein BGX27_006049 [Mortierella sp. AM989]|nr:hypothetical protein BGX27_006049 [Mortierella sp. AM989]
MSAPNATINADTPWKQYYCSSSNPCSYAGTICHHGFCIPELGLTETCKDAKDVVDPFIARIDNVYTLFCDMPTEIKEQSTKCPLGCEVWENCHSDICMVKPCTKDQAACKKGDLNMCNGLRREQIFCYEAIPHGNTHPQTVEAVETGLSSSQVGGIAGGVSAAVVVLALGAFFLVRRRRANKAKTQANGSNQSLPTYSAQDEKNAMKQVVTSSA